MTFRLVCGEAEKASRHFIFIHGWRGDQDGTWAAKSKRKNIFSKRKKVFWPKWLAEDFPGSAVWVVDYPAPATNLRQDAVPPAEVSNSLLQWIKSLDALKHGKVMFIAHSLGGLVAEQILLTAHSEEKSDKASADLLKRTEGVVFFGTPHHGSYHADSLLKVDGIIPWSAATKSLAVDNEHINDVYHRYRNLARDCNFRHLPFAEGQSMSFLGLRKPSKIVESWSNAGVDERVITLMTENHLSMCKLRDRDCQAYTLIRSFLSPSAPPPLPPGFDTPEWVAGESGLRAHLRSDTQSYHEGGSEIAIDQLLKKLEGAGKPLAIIGAGGLGKTRLALELCRASDRKGILIRGGATPEAVSTQIAQAKRENRRLLFMIDYIEEMAAKYDGIHDVICREGGEYAVLVTTTRQLSSEVQNSQSAEAVKAGPEKLTEGECVVVNLGLERYKSWRQEVCQQILAAAKVPEKLRDDLVDLDIPAIATLFAYDFEHHGVAADDQIGQADGGWLLRRLRRQISESLSNENFISLLSLYPLTSDLREKLPSELRSAADVLEKQGWVSRSSASGGAVMEWRLGHDLLCDIPMVAVLLDEHPAHFRYEMIGRLAKRAAELDAPHDVDPAQKLNFLAIFGARIVEFSPKDRSRKIEKQATSRFSRSIQRLLNRLIAATPAPEILDTLEAFVPPLSATHGLAGHAVQAAKKTLLSLSLNLYGKIHVIFFLPDLSDQKIDQLMAVFDTEEATFLNLVKDHQNDIKILSHMRTFGNQARERAILQRFNIVEELGADPRPGSDILGCFIPEYYLDINLTPWNFLADEKDQRDELMPAMHALSVRQRYETYLDAFPEMRRIEALSAEGYRWVAVEMMKLAAEIYRNTEDTFPFEGVIDRFATSKDNTVLEKVASIAFTVALERDKRDQNHSAYDDVIGRFSGCTHPPVQQHVARAMLNKAFRIAERDNDISAFDAVITRYGDSTDSALQELAAKASFQKAIISADRNGDPTAHDETIRLFSKSTHENVLAYVRSARAGRIGWRVVAGQNDLALTEAEEFLADPMGTVEQRSVVAFLAWLARPGPVLAERVEALADDLAGNRTGWTFDEFGPVIAAMTEPDRQFAQRMIGRLEAARE